MRGEDLTPYKIAAVYLLLGIAYIVVSDWLVVGQAAAGWRPGLDTFKGITFVAVSAALIAWLVRRELRRRVAVIKAAEAAQRLEALGRLTAGVSHDFNNLLTVVINSAELLEESSEDDPVKRGHARAILGAGERAARLIDSLLVFARQKPAQPQRFDVNARTRALEPIMRQAAGRGVELDLRLNDGALEVFSDPVQFDAALLNLVVNARDAMPEGGKLKIWSQLDHCGEARSAPLGIKVGAYALINVKDEGQGMPAEVMQRAFEPFYTTKGPELGTGLGLSTVFGFMRESNGTITLDSAPGAGTKVNLYFPLASGK